MFKQKNEMIMGLNQNLFMALMSCVLNATSGPVSYAHSPIFNICDQSGVHTIMPFLGVNI